MVSNFYSDLAKAKKAEDLVREVFSSLTDEYTFIDVSNDRAYFKRGDIKAVDKNGKEVMIEVKNDGCIGRTHNLLCEEENFFFESGTYAKGNFYSSYQIYCVVSQEEQKIYVMDFSILKAHYKSGEFKQVNHPEQICYCYLCPLTRVKQWGAMIAEVEFDKKLL